MRLLTGTSKPWLAVAVIWTLAVLTINSISVRDPTWRPPFSGADKLTHAAMYGAAAYSWRRAIRARGTRVTWLVAAGVALLGAVDEWHQRSVPGRSADALDWVADCLGAGAGMLFWRGVHGRRDTLA